MTDKIEQKKEASKALAMIKAVYEDGEATINGRSYVFNKVKHSKRKDVFSFYSRVGSLGMQFLEDTGFAKVEKLMMGVVTYNGDILSVLGDNHWEEFPEDYLMFITTAMGVISYPFMKGQVIS